jgi:hypothetical protein
LGNYELTMEDTSFRNFCFYSKAWIFKLTPRTIVNDNEAVSDQKIPKFFVSHMEESMAVHVGIMEFIKN